MERLKALQVAIFSFLILAGLAGLSPLRGQSTISEDHTINSLDAAVARATPEALPYSESLDTKRKRVVWAQARLLKLKEKKLSPELSSSISTVEQALEKEAVRLSHLWVADIVASSEDTLSGTVQGIISDYDLDHVAPGVPTGSIRPGLSFDAVIRGTANLRGGPSRNSITVMYIQDGTKVVVLAENGDWFHVKLNDIDVESFVFGDFVELMGSSKETDGDPEDHTNRGNVKPASIESPATHLSDTFESIDGAVRGPQSPIPSLTRSVDNLADNVEKEQDEFKSPAFICRGELDICRRKNFGYLDCELTMIMCLTDVILP